MMLLATRRACLEELDGAVGGGEEEDKLAHRMRAPQLDEVTKGRDVVVIEASERLLDGVDDVLQACESPTS